MHESMNEFLQHSPQYNQNQIFKYNKDLLWCVLRGSTKSIFKTVHQANLCYYFSAVKFYMLMLTIILPLL